jgi:hypothetical protein
MTIIIRTDTVISTNTSYHEAIQIAAGATVTIAAGATLDLGGNTLLLAGNLRLDGTDHAFAGLSNGTVSTENTAGKIAGTYAKLTGVSVDDFFSNGTMDLASSVVDHSHIDALASSSFSTVLFRNTEFSAAGTKNASIADSTFVDSTVVSTAWLGGFSGALKLANVNFVGTGDVIKLDPFFNGAGFTHPIAITNAYIAGVDPANIDSRVFDADDDIRISTDIQPSSFGKTPYTNDARGFVVGGEVVGFAQLGVAQAGPGTVQQGTAGNDVIAGAAAGARIDGAAGVDTVLYGGSAASYVLARTADGFSVGTAGATGDLLVNVERLGFADKSVAIDIDGAGGQVYRLYQAAFDRKPDDGGVGYWLRQKDAGVSLTDIAQGFMQSAEFAKLYGAHPSDEQFVTNLYANVLHRAPDQAGHDYWMALLGQHGDARADMLTAFSESAENQAQVIGSISNGFVYTPFTG